MKLSLNSLMAKIVVFGISLAFLSLAISSSISIINQRADLAEQIRDKGLIFAELSARPIYDNYISFYTQSSDQNFSIFKEQIEKKLARDPDIIDLSIVSVNGRILFDSKELESGRYLGETRSISDQSSLVLLKKESISYQNISVEGKDALEIFVPIEELSGGHIISIRYVLSFDSFNKQMGAAYWRIVWSFLVASILVFLLSLPLYRRIKKPIAGLNELTQKIKKGNLDVKMEVGKSQDEFGALAENFNSMVDELRVLRDKNFDYSKKLEMDVEKKKAEVLSEKETSAKRVEEKDLEIAELKRRNGELEKMNSFMVDREMKIIELKKQLGEKK